ncbi:caspase family protein, partial [Leptolyngbya cf. ectocarpi LEGE 11479]
EPQSVKNRLKDSYCLSTRLSVTEEAINQGFADRDAAVQNNSFRLRQGRHILLSACHEKQTAKEIYIQGKGPRGIFSYCLQQALDKATRQMTYAELLTQVRDSIKKHEVLEQAPQLEIIKGDNTDLQKFFLSQEIQGDVSGVFTLSYDGGWRVHAGHVHGWDNVEATGGVELSIFSFGDKPENIKKGLNRLTTAYVKKVHPTFSQVHINEPQILNEQKLYKALLTKASISSSLLTIFLEGHQAGVEALRRSLVRMDRRLVDAQEVSDASQAMVRLKAGDGEYQIFRGAILGEPLSVPMAVREYRCLEVPTDLSEPLMRIKRWLDLRNLTNTNLGNALSSSLDFQLIQNQELYEGTDFRFECKYRDGRWLIPDIQFQIINRTSSPIYCAVLYLSPEFGVDSTLIEAGELKIGAYDTRQSIEFNLAVPEILVDQGITEYPTFFKLIASNQSFEARIWSQPGLEKVCREILPKKRKGELWLTQEIAIRCDISDKQKNIFDEQVSSGTMKSEFQFQNNNQTIEIDELWAVNKFDLLTELGHLSERSPVVTERPLFKADNAQLPGNSISSSNIFFFTKGKKIFQDIVVQIVNITRVPEKINNYKLVPTIANLSEYDRGQALVLLEKIITEVLNFDQEISSLAAVLIVECYDLNGLRLLFSEYLED